MPPKKDPSTIALTEFDELTIGRSTQMIKALIPFLDPPEQRMLGLMVRVIEFNMTMDFFNRNRISSCAFGPRSRDNILSEIKCYCSPEEQKQLDMMLGVLKAQQIQNAAAQAASSSSPMDMLSGFLTPEQMKLYKEYEQLL